MTRSAANSLPATGQIPTTQIKSFKNTRRPLWVTATAALIPLLMQGLTLLSTELITLCAGILIAGLAIGWGQLTGSPIPVRCGLLVGIIGEGGLLITRITQNLTWISLVLALGLIAAFVVEMTRDAQRTRATWSLAVNLTGAMIVASGAAWGLTSVYPTMNTLAIAALPACGVASLLLAVPCKTGWLRTLLCAVAGGSVSAVLTATYLYQFPDLALAIPYAVWNPQAAVWVMTIGVGTLCGVLVGIIYELFPIPKAPGYHWQQLTLALLPTVFLATILYGLSRLITG